MLHYDFESSIGYWLTLATQAYHRAFSDELAPYGITYRQAQVLGWLALEQQITQSELTARMLIEPPTLVGILDRMERSGWIVRQPSTEDRRKKVIHATDAAEPLWRDIVACAKRMRRRATEGIGPEQLKQVHDTLRQIHANVAGAAESSAVR